jgi:LPS O-antigen subunit length determinant protein (WzzB/FepE family)
MTQDLIWAILLSIGCILGFLVGQGSILWRE